MKGISSLVDRNRQSFPRNGYALFMDIVGEDHCRWMDQMTDADIAFWHDRLDEWEALAEAEKCQYDILAVLGQI